MDPLREGSDMDDGSVAALAIALTALLVGVTIGVGAMGQIGVPQAETGPPKDPPGWETPDGAFATFASAEAFEAYFDGATRSGGSIRTLGGQPVEDVPERAEFDTGRPEDGGGAASAGDSGPRHSETNRQVAALDEPDLLKTDGETAYYANHRFKRGADETTVVDLADPSDPAVVTSLPATGELLLVEASETLVVLDQDRIWGYDVSDPADPERQWDQRLNATIQTARLHDGSLYLVLMDRPGRYDEPCPLIPYGEERIDCTSVYRPGSQANADAVYTAVQIDPMTGGLEDEASVVGSERDSATYVSEDAIYLSYTRSTGEYSLLMGYLTGPAASHLDPETVQQLAELDDLNISRQAKLTELQVIMEEWIESLDAEDRETIERKLREGLTAYASDQQRNLTRTGIVRISMDDRLEVTETGEVPGYPLNQWSMDQHDDHLRIATTVPGKHGSESVNDVYVLDERLEVTGQVQGLGTTERIYSVRFEGDEGYVVTFRQIDPFYTLDLSDPTEPIMEGELKIPGVSHYLHPLADDGELVLGIGAEDRQVKLSTFGVSDRSDPVELDARVLNERFSEVNRNHRAFLHDERHDVFFLPASEHSYVFSYADGELTEEARVDIGGQGVRAMYVGDYLYVFGPEELVVLDETSWEIETRIDLRGA